WVSFGAAITICLLAIDPFIQSIIFYSGDFSNVDSMTASIARASMLDIGSWGRDPGIDIEYHGQGGVQDTYRSWQPSFNDTDLLEYIKEDFGNSLAELYHGLEPSWPTVIPRSDLKLQILDPNGRLPSGLQQVFNITQKAITTMMADVDDELAYSVNMAITDSTNITASFENAARLISFRMREMDNATQVGATEQWVIYIRVRWGFLAAPAILTVAAIAFSIHSIIRSHKIQHGTIESDPLKMLVAGLQHDARESVMTMASEGKKPDSVVVGLYEGKQGVELGLGR
ncbi:hypothetical protein EDB81DRAFT_654754, partial [Dactylonectria macrodidyma]